MAENVRRQLRHVLDALSPRREPLLEGAVPVAARRQALKLREQFRTLGSRPANIAVAAALVVCAVIAFMVGRSLPSNESESTPSDISTQVTGGHLTLVGWVGWEQGRAPRQVTELVRSARVVSPTGTDVSVVLGDLPFDRVPRLFGVLGLQASSAEKLNAGSVSAQAFTGVLPGADPQSVTALLVPSRTGVSTAVCLGDTRTSESAEDCRTVLTTTATLRGTEPASAAPTASQATALRSSINDFDSRRRRDAAVLSAAATSGRQSNAAELLSSDYEAVATRASAVDFTPLARASGRALVTQLNEAATAYAQLARAADASSQSGYTAALDRALDADAKVAQSLNQLTALGYGGAER